jgi:hypothetical protein
MTTSQRRPPPGPARQLRILARDEPLTVLQARFEGTDPTVATPGRTFGSGGGARTISELDLDAETQATSAISAANVRVPRISRGRGEGPPGGDPSVTPARLAL